MNTQVGKTIMPSLQELKQTKPKGGHKRSRKQDKGPNSYQQILAELHQVRKQLALVEGAYRDLSNSYNLLNKFTEEDRRKLEWVVSELQTRMA